MIIRTNASELLTALLDSGLTASAAAAMAGVSTARFVKFLHEDTRISYSTASKLRKHFGDAVIIIGE